MDVTFTQFYFGVGTIAMFVAWGWSRAWWAGAREDTANGIVFGMFYGFLSLIAWPMAMLVMYFWLTDKAKYGWRL
jgi:hypothetical protein